MAESSDAGEVRGRFLYNHMVESSDAGEVRGRFFKIIWSFGFKVKSYLHG